MCSTAQLAFLSVKWVVVESRKRKIFLRAHIDFRALASTLESYEKSNEPIYLLVRGPNSNPPHHVDC